MGFTRNPASQIVGETRDNNAYAWDGHVNVVREYAANGLNQYTQVGAGLYCHDANGNLTFPAALFRPEKRASRWTLILRAAGALAAGASQREIVEHLLGVETGPRWRIANPSARRHAQRLVEAAKRARNADQRSWLAGDFSGTAARKAQVPFSGLCLPAFGADTRLFRAIEPSVGERPWAAMTIRKRRAGA